MIRSGTRLLVAKVEDLAGAIAEGIAAGSDAHVAVESLERADRIANALDRLNDNIEAIIVNGLDVRMHAGICVSPPGDVVMNSADAVICRQFLARAIASGDLHLKSSRPAGICLSCGCTDEQPCDPPCSWVDRNHTICSACAPPKRGIQPDGGRQ